MHLINHVIDEKVRISGIMRKNSINPEAKVRVAACFLTKSHKLTPLKFSFSNMILIEIILNGWNCFEEWKERDVCSTSQAVTCTIPSNLNKVKDIFCLKFVGRKLV